MSYLISALFYRADEKIDSTHNNELTLLTHAGMGDHLNTKYETPSYNVTAHRLVRKDDKLEAMVSFPHRQNTVFPFNN